MNVQVRTSTGTTLVPIETKLMAERKIFLEGYITDETAGNLIKMIMVLNREDEEKEIDIMINSNGGEINAGMMIYDAVQASLAPIRMYCIGKAYSMAAILFASGNCGRYILPHGEVLLHEPLVGKGVGGNCTSIKFVSDNLLEVSRKMIQLLERHTGRTEDEITLAMRSEHYFSPRESVDFGLCDEVVSFDKIL